jgi:hypothetical protein
MDLNPVLDLGPDRHKDLYRFMAGCEDYLAFTEKRMDNSVSEWIDGQLWYAEKILPGQISLLLLI